MIDLHTHLFWKSYGPDRDEAVKRAREAGVTHMVSVGTTLEESALAVHIAEKYSGILATVGVHPHEFNVGGKHSDGSFEFIGELRELAHHEKVRAIGECGLDYFSHDPEKIISEEEKKSQKNGFLAQAALAKELNLPLIIHCRDAYEDMVEILKNEGQALKAVILHCYMGDTEVTKRFLELSHAYFSFTGNITYPVKKGLVGTKDDLAETVKLIPLERLFTETDCPFLAPQGKRGERNEPAFVKYVVEKVAELQRQDVKAVESMVEKNYRKVFNV